MSLAIHHEVAIGRKNKDKTTDQFKLEFLLQGSTIIEVSLISYSNFSNGKILFSPHR